MKTFSLCIALLIGCLAVAVVGDDPYCEASAGSPGIPEPSGSRLI